MVSDIIRLLERPSMLLIEVAASSTCRSPARLDGGTAQYAWKQSRSTSAPNRRNRRLGHDLGSIAEARHRRELRHLVAQPGQLALGIAPGLDRGALERAGEVDPSLEVAEQLAHRDRLHQRRPRRQAKGAQ